NEMVPNAPKHYETQEKLSLGSIGVDQVRSLRKHPTQLRGTNFCINCTSSAHFALSLLPQQKMSLISFGLTCLAAMLPVSRAQRSDTTTAFDKTVQPFLSSHCYVCHNA